MALSKDQKKSVVSEINALLEESNSVVVTEYKGLTVENITNLRNDLRKEGITYKVAKKTLFNKAMEEKNLPGLSEDVMKEAQVAFAFSKEDEIAPFRILAQNFKKLKKGKLMAGYIGEDAFGTDKAKELADLPSKEELIAKMVGGFKAPLSKFHGVLSNTMGGFVRVLDAIQEKQAS